MNEAITDYLLGFGRFAILVLIIFGMLASAEAAGVTQVRTNDSDRTFTGVFFHGAPVFVPDPRQPGGLHDLHITAFGNGANWIDRTLFDATVVPPALAAAAGPAQIKHQIAPHGEAPTGFNVLDVDTTLQGIPLPIPNLGMAFDVDTEAPRHGTHIDKYAMMILAGFVGNNLTGYLGILIGQHIVPVDKILYRSFYAPLEPSRLYDWKSKTGDNGEPRPVFGGALISMGGTTEENVLVIAAMGISAGDVTKVQIRLGTPEKPGETLLDIATDTLSEQDEMGLSHILIDKLPQSVVEGLSGRDLYLELVTESGSLTGQIKEVKDQ